jgi:hypothetical protein
MWQLNSGWGHAVSKDLAHWSVLQELAIAGPNTWDGSLTILDGKPVVMFDCTDPKKDRVGWPHSCSGLNTTEFEADQTSGRVGIGDPSFLGIARPTNLSDANLTTWSKDPTAPISVLNETDQPASGYSGPSPIWTTTESSGATTKNLVMTYGAGHTGLFCSQDASLREWKVCNGMFYPDRLSGGGMFLPLPGPPTHFGSRQRIATTATAAGGGVIPFTHLLFGVTPGLGKGVAALGVYNPTARTFSNSSGPPPTYGLRPLGAHPDSSATTKLGDCIACGEKPDGTRVCCADLAAGYRKETFDAGEVRFGEVFVEPSGKKRMLWFAWAGDRSLSSIREITYEHASQQLLMWPVDELLQLRDPTPLGTLSAPASLPNAHATTALFTSNSTSFDAEATLALPSSGGKTSFGMAIMAARAPVAGGPVSASAVLMVIVSAVDPADGARLVSMSLASLASKDPSDHLIQYNFSLPASETELGVRVLADAELVEAFVAGGRGVITIPTVAPVHGGAGLYLLGGAAGAATVESATAWAMCM